MQILDANLHLLEIRSSTDMRRMTELMIDTGRRPDEICQLRLDCLTRDTHGNPGLIYTDAKTHRPPHTVADRRGHPTRPHQPASRCPGNPPRPCGRLIAARPPQPTPPPQHA